MDNYLNQVLGNRYEIQELIGIGGMAVVYKALDLNDKRIVAVKILKNEFLSNEEFRIRFANESRAIAMLAHPNIVKIFDVYFGDDIQYIVMEHVEGIMLKEYIQRQQIIEWKDAVHFTVQILRALQHAHDKGIIHRDIKPQNILLLPNASIKVTDFGIAQCNRGGGLSVNEESAIGSVHYVSPEQACGGSTDAKSDIYSVGIVLYEMLTGKLPFESENDNDVALMQLRDDAVRPSLINASIPIGLEQITLRAMQKDPNDRYHSAAEFLLDLDEFKRNPQIKFDYNFFVDQTPTKHIGELTDESEPVRANDASEETVVDESEPKKSKFADIFTHKHKADVTSDDGYDDEIDVTEDDDDDEDDYTPRNITVPILVSIAICLVVVVGLVILAAFGDTIRAEITGENVSTSNGTFLERIDIFGLFDKEKIEVPNFLNMKYEDVHSKYPDLIIDDPPQYEYNSAYDDGHVCNQSPSAGERVSKDTIIKLTVATSGKMILVPDVAGYTIKDAENALTNAGLSVILVAQVDDSKEDGTVISTNPSANKYTERGGIVYLYYAASAIGEDAVIVPEVLGYDLDAARAKIEDAGLKVGSVTTGASSAAMEGMVISQPPSELSRANPGEYVNLVIGSGKPSSNTIRFNIPLPDAGNEATGTVKTFLNDTAYDSIEDVELNGSSFALSFTGSGADNTFKIYIDSVLIYSGYVDFTVSPPAISDLRDYGYTARSFIPNVAGKTLSEATEMLNAAGFYSIHTRYESDPDVASGYVVSQSPKANTSDTYTSDTVITLVVSSGSDFGNAQNGDANTRENNGH